MSKFFVIKGNCEYLYYDNLEQAKSATKKAAKEEGGRWFVASLISEARHVTHYEVIEEDFE